MTGGTTSEAGRGTSGPPGAATPPEAYAVALAGLPLIGPSTLSRLVRGLGPEQAWSEIVAGRSPFAQDGPAPLFDAGAASGMTPPPPARGMRPEWPAAARATDPSEVWASCRAAGIEVVCYGGSGYPARLLDDPEPPGVLFYRGSLRPLAGLCIAIVGTRRCTHYGRDVARRLGRDLACQGACIVSGVALGIDGAAHLGALDAGRQGATVGIAASGVDVPYPRRHAELWDRMCLAGAVVSESPPGSPALAWRFPSRNRIIAGLAHGLVVVESGLGGGSMLTVTSAMARGRAVMAVPGAVTSPASAGTNQLLSEGAGVARHAADVLDALGSIGLVMPPPEPREPHALSTRARQVLAAVDWTPTATGEILTRSGLSLAQVSPELHRLGERGLVTGGAGWWERRRPQ
jgi:DNA processing protein